MEKIVAVIDYGLGNLRSVSKAFEAVGARVKVTNDTEDIAGSGAIVLPGVGAFKRAMDNLTELKIISAITEAIKAGKPFLGICLGLQILFTETEEHGLHKGLGIIKGRVRKFAAGVKVPHMGWNSVKLQRTENREQRTDLFSDIPNGSYFYFVHSYFVEPQEEGVIVATTEYGQQFCSMVNKDNLWGVQFHPEKSEKVGLKLLENFCRYVS